MTLSGVKKKRTLQIPRVLIALGKANVKNFIKHKFALDKYKEALEVGANKSKHSAIKIVFEYFIKYRKILYFD